MFSFESPSLTELALRPTVSLPAVLTVSGTCFVSPFPPVPSSICRICGPSPGFDSSAGS